MNNKNRRVGITAVLLLIGCAAISWVIGSRPGTPEVLKSESEPALRYTTTFEPSPLRNDEQLVLSRREPVECDTPVEPQAVAPPKVAEESLPKIYFWGTTAIARWKDGQSRLELCFPILQVSSTANTSVKIWGVRRGEQPYLLAHSEFAYRGVSTYVTVYRREIEIYEQVVVTCGACEGRAAQVLATVSGPPEGFKDALSNPDPIATARIVSYQQVSPLGDLERLTYDLQPGEQWPVPQAAWALITLDG